MSNKARKRLKVFVAGFMFAALMALPMAASAGDWWG